MKLTEFLNDDTCQIFLAIIVGIVICYFIFGSCGSCSTGCSRRDGFSVGGQKFNPPEQVNCVNRVGVFACKSGGKMNFPTSEQIDCSNASDTQNYVLGACCDDVGEHCTSGISSCDAECYNALNTVIANCPDNLPFPGIDDSFNEYCVTAFPQGPPNLPSDTTPGTGTGADTTPGTGTGADTTPVDCSSIGQLQKIQDLRDICPEESGGNLASCPSNCKIMLNAYDQACRSNTDYIKSPIKAQWTEMLGKCNPQSGNAGNSGNSPVTVIPEDIAKDMFTDSQYSTIRSNLSASGINTASELNDHGIYPLVLHSGSFTGSVVFGGNSTRDFTTVHLMNGSNVMRNGLTLGSIAQAQASIFVSGSNTSSIGLDRAKSLEMQEFCGPGGVYGGRIDPGAKMVSEPTFNDNPDMCGMNAIASLGVTDYRNAVENRIRPLVNDNYATEIGGSYKSDTQIPVAKVDTKYIDVSQMQPDTSGYVHIVINFPNGAPNSDGSSVADSSAAGIGGKYLVIMSTGLSDGTKKEPAKQSPMKALRSLRELQYLVNKSQTDVTQFMDSQYDPYYSASGTVTCNSDTGCSLSPLSGTFNPVQQNVACRQAHAEIQTYGLMLVKLSTTGQDGGYSYLTPDDLVRTTTNLEVTPDGEGIIDLDSDTGKTYRATGNFFIFENNGIKYIVPKHVSTSTLDDILGSPECDTRQSPECCQKIIEQGSMPDLAMQNPNLHRYCNTLINLGTSTSGNGNAPGAGNTPPPSTGGNTACWLANGNECPPETPTIKSGAYYNGTESDYQQKCCGLPADCTSSTNNIILNESRYGLGGMLNLGDNICTWLCTQDDETRTSVCDNLTNVRANCCACQTDCP